MPNALILTSPSTMTAPLPGTPRLRLPGDAVTLTSDTFTGATVTTLAGRFTDAAKGGAPLPWQFSNPAAFGITAGRLVPGSSTGVGVALVELTPRPADLQASVKITARPASSDTSATSWLTLRRSSVTSAPDQIRVGFSGENVSLFVQLAGSQGFVSGSVTPYAAGDTIAVREYRGLVQMLINGAVVASSQHPAGTFTGPFAGITSAAGSQFGFDDFTLTETIH